MKIQHVIIVGAGPAGLMAAQTFVDANGGAMGEAEAQTAQNLEIHVFDRMPSAGRKFLMAGRGGLNLTHSEDLKIFQQSYANDSAWVRQYIRAFPPSQLVAWADALGGETFVGSSGRVFPKAMKASPLLRAWLRSLNEKGVQFHLGHEWQGCDENQLHQFKLGDGSLVTKQADISVLAMGGASWPRLGSDGSWQPLLLKHGVRSEELVPSNMGFSVEWSQLFQEKFAGAALKSCRMFQGEQSRVGELMITEAGLEGGLMYAFSAQLRDQIDLQGYARVKIDLCPQWTKTQCEVRLGKIGEKSSLSNRLRKGLGLSGARLALFNEARAKGQIEGISDRAIVNLLKGIPLELTDYAGLERAISSAGGVARSSVTETLMLKNLPGVFACGEMLDWEAPTGGYLLQACFATGVAAASGALAHLQASEAIS